MVDASFVLPGDFTHTIVPVQEDPDYETTPPGHIFRNKCFEIKRNVANI